MKAVVDNEKLIITMDDHIDAVNAQDVLKQLLAFVEKAEPHNVVILDAENLEYISSAGFRTLFTLRESQPDPVILVNVSPIIYETFEVTGFTELVEIHTDDE